VLEDQNIHVVEAGSPGNGEGPKSSVGDPWNDNARCFTG